VEAEGMTADSAGGPRPHRAPSCGAWARSLRKASAQTSRAASEGPRTRRLRSRRPTRQPTNTRATPCRRGDRLLELRGGTGCAGSDPDARPLRADPEPASPDRVVRHRARSRGAWVPWACAAESAVAEPPPAVGSSDPPIAGSDAGKARASSIRAARRCAREDRFTSPVGLGRSPRGGSVARS
jgi:hypothetical protein